MDSSTSPRATSAGLVHPFLLAIPYGGQGVAQYRDDQPVFLPVGFFLAGQDSVERQNPDAETANREHSLRMAQILIPLLILILILLLIFFVLNPEPSFFPPGRPPACVVKRGGL